MSRASMPNVFFFVTSFVILPFLFDTCCKETRVFVLLLLVTDVKKAEREILDQTPIMKIIIVFSSGYGEEYWKN